MQKVAKSLCHHARFRSALLTGGRKLVSSFQYVLRTMCTLIDDIKLINIGSSNPRLHRVVVITRRRDFLFKRKKKETCRFVCSQRKSHVNIQRHGQYGS